MKRIAVLEFRFIFIRAIRYQKNFTGGKERYLLLFIYWKLTPREKI